MKRAQSHFSSLWTESATREKNDALYPRVAAGDAEAREEMIRSNLALVIDRVEHYVRVFPRLKHLRDDLFSYGTIGLIEAVNKMQADGPKEDQNPSAHMSVLISHHIGAGIEQEMPVRIPYRTKKRKLDQGTPLHEPEQEMTICVSEGDEDQSAFIYDPQPMQDIRDGLDACCENDTEREIIRLREEGHVDREIAEMLGLPLTTAYVMRRTLYARFLELMEWKGQA